VPPNVNVGAEVTTTSERGLNLSLEVLDGDIQEKKWKRSGVAPDHFLVQELLSTLTAKLCNVCTITFTIDRKAELKETFARSVFVSPPGIKPFPICSESQSVQ
jgi:hypothetical protein